MLTVVALYFAFLMCAGAIGAGAILTVAYVISRVRGRKAVR